MTKWKIGISELYLIMLLFLLINNGNTNDVYFNLLRIPNSIGYTIIVILVFLLIIIMRKIEINNIASAMLMRSGWMFIALILNLNNFGKLSLFFTTIIQMLIYILVYNSKKFTIEKYVDISKIVFLIISIETIMVGIPRLLENSYVKVDMLISIGGSNYLGCILNVLFAIIIFNEVNPKKRFVFTIIWILSIVATQSTTSLILGTVFLAIYLMVYLKKSAYKVIPGITISVFVIVIVLNWNSVYGVLSSGLFDRISDVITNIFSGNKNLFDRAFNGRIDLFNNSIDLIKNRIIIGYGTNYEVYLGSNSHNLITDLLLQGGLFNLLIFLYILVSSFRFSLKFKKEGIQTSFIFATIVTILQGLFEPNFQGFSFSIIYFALMGFAMKEGAACQKKRV